MMNPKEEKQQQVSEAKRPSFWEKYGGAPLAFIMRNPKMTPIVLLVLGVVPILITALVLALYFFWQPQG